MPKRLFSKCDMAILFNDEDISGPDPNFLHACKKDYDGSILIFSKRQKKILLSPLNPQKITKKDKVKNIAISPKDWKDYLKKETKDKVVGLDFSSISAQRFLRLKKIFNKKIVNISDELAALRLQKDRSELKKIRKAVSISKKILDSLDLKKGISEIQLRDQLIKESIDHGCSLSYPPIVAFSKNSSNPHHLPSKKKLCDGIVLIDFGVRYQNYCSDLTRCYFIGPCKREREEYSNAKSIYDEILDDLEYGMDGCQLDVLSREVMKRYGWPEPIHAIGHGLGIQVHEPPFFHPGDKTKITENQVFAIEPGCYRSSFGVRFENDVIMTKKGPKTIR